MCMPAGTPSENGKNAVIQKRRLTPAYPWGVSTRRAAKQGIQSHTHTRAHKKIDFVTIIGEKSELERNKAPLGTLVFIKPFLAIDLWVF